MNKTIPKIYKSYKGNYDPSLKKAFSRPITCETCIDCMKFHPNHYLDHQYQNQAHSKNPLPEHAWETDHENIFIVNIQCKNEICYH